MTTRLFALFALIPVLLWAACSDQDDEAKPTATPSQSATAAVTGSPSATNTTPPLATTTPTSTVIADGTVDPLNPGQTTPWDVKAQPENTAPVRLTAVRMGVHPEAGGWDRIVFEFEGSNRPAARIEYVNSASQCGSGQAVTLPGTAVLQIRISPAEAHTPAGTPSIPSANIQGPGSTILRAIQTCDFEGVVTWSMGVKAKQNFKVITLENPVRIVIDVKH